MRTSVCCVALTGLVGLLCGFSALAGELHEAARRGNLSRVEELLAGKTPVDATDGSGATPLYLAASEGHAPVVARLLAAGANWRHRVMGFQGSVGTPLHVAIRNGHPEAVGVLLEAGVDPNLQDEGVGSPLHVARESGQVAIETRLRAFGAREVKAEPVDDLLASADLAGGELIAGACAACHDLTRQRGEFNRQGPLLWGVVGRTKAGMPGYEYSAALRGLGGRWTYGDLSSFIADPRGFVPGTKMRFRGIAERERRAALIAYLRMRADQPAPLP